MVASDKQSMRTLARDYVALMRSRLQACALFKRIGDEQTSARMWSEANHYRLRARSCYRVAK